jgi:hypothetical protein
MRYFNYYRHGNRDRTMQYVAKSQEHTVMHMVFTGSNRSNLIIQEISKCTYFCIAHGHPPSSVTTTLNCIWSTALQILWLHTHTWSRRHSLWSGIGATATAACWSQTGWTESYHIVSVSFFFTMHMLQECIKFVHSMNISSTTKISYIKQPKVPISPQDSK